MVAKSIGKELSADQIAREEKLQQIRALEKTAGPKVRITSAQLGQVRQKVMVLGG